MQLVPHQRLVAAVAVDHQVGAGVPVVLRLASALHSVKFSLAPLDLFHLRLDAVVLEQMISLLA